MAAEIKRLTINLDADAADLLPVLAGSPRKQGEFLSNLIRAASAGQGILQQATPGAEVESLRLQVLGLASELRSLRDDLIRRGVM